VARAERGDGEATPLGETGRHQADVILRMRPTPLPVANGAGPRVDRWHVLREPPWETSRPSAVRGQAPTHAAAVGGAVQA